MSSQISKGRTVQSNTLKAYLVAYNSFSFIGWAYLLAMTFIHVFNLDGKSDTLPSPPNLAARSLFADFFALSQITVEPHLPFVLKSLCLRATTTYFRLGPAVLFVQTFATLEIIHVLVGWVKAPIVTTFMQVFSRLFALWGVYDHYPQVHSNPYYASMLLVWSMTEVIRYSFYAFTLLGGVPYPLLWLRYTTFYVLYPIGVLSEATAIYATLPVSSPWRTYDFVRAFFFVIWWPSLYVLYTHMIKQRRKVLGGGKTVKRE